MKNVEYSCQIDYSYDNQGRRYPQLAFRLSKVSCSTPCLDTNAYLDSGAERSLFSGGIGVLLGLDVLKGSRLMFETAAGGMLAATVHPVRPHHPVLGAFDLEVGFSSTELRRNLLGRDFFNFVQIGFRERYLTFFVTPTP